MTAPVGLNGDAPVAARPLVRVLLADDTADLRSLVRAVLESAGGFQVVAEAADGREAVMLAERFSPDLAVVDVAMPVMSGLQAIPEMRRLLPELRIAVLTVFDLTDLEGQALAAGADICLDKTRPPSELISALGALAGVSVADSSSQTEAWVTHALRESQAGFNGAFDEAAIGMAITDFEGRPLRVNTALGRILAATADDVMSRPLWQRVVGGTAADGTASLAERAPWGKVPQPGVTFIPQVEQRWQRADGRIAWVTIDASAVHDNFGRPLYLFCQIQDVTTRRRAEEALRASEARFRMLADNASDLIAMHDADTTFRYVSPSCRDILGFTPTELIGRRATELFHPDEVDTVLADLQRGGDGTITIRVRSKDGHWVWLEVGRRVLTDPVTGEIIELQTASRDVTERKLLEHRLTELAMHDGLTGLANRMLLLDRLEHALARRGASEGQVAVLFVDLDRFKLVNDSLGHRAGDLVLQTTADRLLTCIRPADTAARLGGDEFVIVCEDLTGEDEAIAVAERIERALAEPHPRLDRRTVVTASVGIAIADSSVQAEALLHRADSAMYEAKQAGRAQHRMWR